MINTHALKVGDRVTVSEPGRKAVDMTVWMITPAGSNGLARSHGPRIHVHIRSGGNGVAFDQGSPVAQHITRADEA